MYKADRDKAGELWKFQKLLVSQVVKNYSCIAFAFLLLTVKHKLKVETVQNLFKIFRNFMKTFQINFNNLT